MWLGANCLVGMNYHVECLRLLGFLYFLLFLSSGYCFLFRKYLVDEYFCLGWWQELAGMIMSVVVCFLHMLNSNESICLVIVMSRKFILLFCSGSMEKDSSGSMLLRSVRRECMLRMIWSFIMRLSTY